MYYVPVCVRKISLSITCYSIIILALYFVALAPHEESDCSVTVTYFTTVVKRRIHDLFSSDLLKIKQTTTKPINQRV